MIEINKKYQLIADGDSVLFESDSLIYFYGECLEFAKDNTIYDGTYLVSLGSDALFKLITENCCVEIKIRNEEFKTMKFRTYNVTLSSSDIVTFTTDRNLIEVIDYLTAHKFVEVYEHTAKIDRLPTIIFRKHIVKVREVK